MFRLSASQLTTYRSTFDEDVFRCTACGIGALGVWRQKVEDFGLEKSRELLCESGIKVSNLLWAGGFTGSDGRSELALASLLFAGFTALSVVAPFPTATVPSILGKRMAR